jgi:protein-tyrosine-phosphatase
MAEALLRAQFEEMCVGATAASAGVLDGDRPAAPAARTVMAARDLDLSAHRSRCLSNADLSDADVVLAMAREHVREVVMFDPSSWSKTFTLKELVRRAEQHGARAPGQPFDEWLAKIHVGRERHELLGESPLDDIADPVGGPPEQFEATAQELSALLERFVDLAWGAA